MDTEVKQITESVLNRLHDPVAKMVWKEWIRTGEAQLISNAEVVSQSDPVVQ